MNQNYADYTMGKPNQSWQEGTAKTVTFIVTENCQLRCRYCYIHGKNNINRMEFEIAKKTVDYLLENRNLFSEKSVIWEFIGGEPFIEIELIDKICDYIKVRMYELEHPWFNSYRFSFSTNGIQYGNESIQKYIEKNKMHLSIGITIDGTKEKHDLQRIYPDGSGSYNDVVKNIPLWLEQFPDAATKVTVSHDDLPLISESVIHLWDLGIKNISINVVFEDCWATGDDLVFESELKKLVDYIIDNRIYLDHKCSFFDDSAGNSLDRYKDNGNWCGAGRMLAVDYKGDFYPCIRFAPFSMTKAKPRKIGDCFSGINLNRLRPFLSLTRVCQSTNECVECDVAGGCAWCQGANLDESETETIFQRGTYHCLMHKARVRANNYYREKFKKIKNNDFHSQ